MKSRRVWTALCASLGLLGGGGAALAADNLVFVPLPGCRVIDTRITGAGGPLAAGTARTFFFRGPARDYSTSPNQGGSAAGCGIPDLGTAGINLQNIAQALAINIVAVGPTGPGDLRAWAANLTQPNASVLNYAKVAGLNLASGVIVPMCNEVAAAPCASGDITFLADVSGTDLVVDVVGYFHAGSTQANLWNTALGHLALQSNTTGKGNTAIGAYALRSNDTATYNTATGFGALPADTTGSANTALGSFALNANTTGAGNTAVGKLALYFGNGSANTALGVAALQFNTTGNNNIGIGENGGLNLTTGSYNIDIGHVGVAGEGQTIRIGYPGVQNRAFIAGIRGVTTGANDAIPVLIDSKGQLGTASSSLRTKQDIADVGALSDKLLDLRPVKFRYKEQAERGDTTPQFGLIAEEVAKVFPELVVYDQQGRPETVKYHLLPALLLDELQKEHAALATASAKLVATQAEVDALLARIEALERRSPAAPVP